MAKRTADKELTDRNWDQNDDKEEAGTFSLASEEVLKNRPIKKAKRKTTGSEANSSGAFKGFKGLNFAGGGSGFSGFGSSGAFKPLEGLTNGNSTPASSFSLSGFKATSETKVALGVVTSNGPTVASSLFQKTTTSVEADGRSSSGSSSISGQNKLHSSTNFNKLLTALNFAVRDWIIEHVNKNPLCILTPVFKDYETHLATIEQQSYGSTGSGSHDDTKDKKSDNEAVISYGTSELHKESGLLNKAQDGSSELNTSASIGCNVTFNFGKKIDSSVLGSVNSGLNTGFSFGNLATESLFGKDLKRRESSPPFTPTVLKPEAGSSDKKDGEDREEENEEPPKVVVNEVKEDDAFYSKKCKLFYKKDDAFKEKGVGTLHLKPVGDKKTQLLIRADTALGNILLNILIQQHMPCTRTANNLIIVCVPNPPIDEKNPTTPYTMLIRVKTAEDAEELHKILMEKKET